MMVFSITNRSSSLYYAQNSIHLRTNVMLQTAQGVYVALQYRKTVDLFGIPKLEL